MIRAGFGNGEGVWIDARACSTAEQFARQALNTTNCIDVGEWSTAAANQFLDQLSSVRSALSDLVDRCTDIAESAWTCEYYRNC